MFTASQFSNPRSCAQIYKVKILGRPPLRWRVCPGMVLSAGTYTEASKLYKALVNEMKHDRGTIILGLFAIEGICNRCCYMQPTSLGNVTPYFPMPSFIIIAMFLSFIYCYINY